MRTFMYTCHIAKPVKFCPKKGLKEKVALYMIISKGKEEEKKNKNACCFMCISRLVIACYHVT